MFERIHSRDRQIIGLIELHRTSATHQFACYICQVMKSKQQNVRYSENVVKVILQTRKCAASTNRICKQNTTWIKQRVIFQTNNLWAFFLSSLPQMYKSSVSVIIRMWLWSSHSIAYGNQVVCAQNKTIARPISKCVHIDSSAAMQIARRNSPNPSDSISKISWAAFLFVYLIELF